MTPPRRSKAENRAACARQLYDEWKGHYVLQQLFMGAWCDVRPLSREEAMVYVCAEDEGLLLVADCLKNSQSC